MRKGLQVADGSLTRTGKMKLMYVHRSNHAVSDTYIHWLSNASLLFADLQVDAKEACELAVACRAAVPVDAVIAALEGCENRWKHERGARRWLHRPWRFLPFFSSSYFWLLLFLGCLVCSLAQIWEDGACNPWGIDMCKVAPAIRSEAAAGLGVPSRTTSRLCALFPRMEADVLWVSEFGVITYHDFEKQPFRPVGGNWQMGCLGFHALPSVLNP